MGKSNSVHRTEFRWRTVRYESTQQIKKFSGGFVILRNSGKDFAIGQDFKEPIKGICVGSQNIVEDRRNYTAMIYDMGIPYYPPLTAEQIAARKAAPMLEFQKIKEKAEDGNPSARYLLGMRYLKGEGCETNRDLAIHWLQKATDAGYPDASNQLAKLQSPLTNSVAGSQ
jgi:TPR repeat protein